MSDPREALVDLIDGAIPDDLPGYRQRYTDRAADAILAAGWTPPRERTAGEDLALIRQTIREVKVETLREAASAAVTEGEGIPWDHDHDRATVSAWLLGFAARIARGEGS